MFVSRPVCVWVEIAIFFGKCFFVHLHTAHRGFCCLRTFIPDTIAAFYAGDLWPSVRKYTQPVKTAWHIYLSGYKTVFIVLNLELKEYLCRNSLHGPLLIY